MSAATHAYPALHNAMWPGLVGKGPDSEPPIDLDTMLNLTAAAEADGVRFEGVDLFLTLPHTDIDASDDELKACRRGRHAQLEAERHEQWLADDIEMREPTPLQHHARIVRRAPGDS